MASRNFQHFPIQTTGGIALCDAQCASDHEGNAVFAVFGYEEQDRALTGLYRADIANELKRYFTQHTGQEVREISLFVDRGSDHLEGTRIEYGADGQVTRAVADYGDSMSVKAVTDLATQFHTRDWQHQMDVAQNSFNPQNRPDPGDLPR